ncbi:four helix bundle protein [Flavisolibacter nicotianae]|uniref:four helix bundle protein n=1 Tax=Flavisolibacter nicotianae TaxID=2364882 RepID=UPI0013C4E78F|nr:four helix bundle protein [Flavisolibacter nicotianae]
MAYLDFTEMPAWQLAAEVVKEVYDLSALLPRSEDYALRGQVREAAIGMTGNIAEGFGRLYGKDKTNFYLYARGSSYEVRSHLLVGHKVGYFTLDAISSINAKCLKVVEELNKIIKNLSSTPSGSSNKNSTAQP